MRFGLGIWLYLAAVCCRPFGASAADVPASPVYLNHCYATVDPATFTALRQSEALRRLCALAERTTTAENGETWSGLYLYGRSTYLEFFAATDKQPAGTCGIGLGIEQPGGLNLRVRQLTALPGVTWDVGLRERMREGRSIPWFHHAGTTFTEHGLACECWLMEYHPDYLRNWYPESPAANHGITRVQYLANRYDPAKPLREISGVTLAVFGPQREGLTRLLSALGYSVALDGTTAVAAGPDWRLRLVEAAPERCGVTAIELQLNGKLDPPLQTVGPTRLEQHNDRTVWSLAP